MLHIGLLKSAAGESRVLLTPRMAGVLTAVGAQVFVEHDAGAAAGFSDEDYRRVGARVIFQRTEVLGRADVALMASPASRSDMRMLRPNTTLMGLLNPSVGETAALAAAREREIAVVDLSQATTEQGRQPVRERMSEVAGAVAAQLAASLLETPHSRGILLGGVPGLPPAEVVVLGAGVLGRSAARAFLGMGALVHVLDADLEVLRALERESTGRLITTVASAPEMARAAAWADVLVGAVRAKHGAPPILVSPKMGRRGAVWLDLAVDHGGCIEGSRPIHSPAEAYVMEGVLCCPIPNLPSRVARTASRILSDLIGPTLRTEAEAGHFKLERAAWIAAGRCA